MRENIMIFRARPGLSEEGASEKLDHSRLHKVGIWIWGDLCCVFLLLSGRALNSSSIWTSKD